MFTWHDAEQERELLPCAIWPFSHRGWQTLKRNVSWLKEREPGNDTWNPPESCALNNLQTNMATDWFFNLHQEYLEKGREHIYIYTGMCVCLCVWKKNPLGGSWSFKFYSLSQLWSYLSGQSLSHSTPSTHLLFLGTKPQEQQLCGDNDFSPLTWCQVLCSPCQSLVVIGVVSSRYRNTKLLVVLPLMYMLGVIDSK